MEIEKGNYVGAVFVDLSKAFDMVNHTLLIDKLSSLGITGIENRWFKSYLITTAPSVFLLMGTISTPNVIRSGVPQGSILGPLLFLLFINDMPKNVVNCSIDMYADDTLIYVCHNDIDVIEKCLNEDLASPSKGRTIRLQGGSMKFRLGQVFFFLQPGRERFLFFIT